MWHNYAAHGWAWMGFMMLASVLVLVAAGLWFIELAAGWPWRDRDHPVRDEIRHLEHRDLDAFELLDARLARGELDPEEYRARRRALVDGRRDAP
jgi:uncharacterized membrane protein